MITRETHYLTCPYDYFFRVFDDEEKIVTIELEEEWGVSSGPCKNWEEGLAEALVAAFEYVKDKVDLLFPVYFHEMISNYDLFRRKLQEYIDKSKTNK